MIKKLVIIVAIILIVGFTSIIAFHLDNYKTWGANEFDYYNGEGYEVECDINLFSRPTNCSPIIP